MLKFNSPATVLLMQDKFSFPLDAFCARHIVRHGGYTVVIVAGSLSLAMEGAGSNGSLQGRSSYRGTFKTSLRDDPDSCSQTP